jgi:tripartite motif-containing protein 71
MLKSYALGRLEMKNNLMLALTAVLSLPDLAASAPSLQFVSQFGGPGSGSGQFSSPTSLAFDNNGDMYVCDAGNQRIQKFNSSGSFILAWGAPGNGNGMFNGVIDVAVASDGSVYTTEADNHRVQRFSSNGAFLGVWGSYGSCQGEFDTPEGIAVDPTGAVYVGDTRNGRIEKFTSDGTFIKSWGSWPDCWPGEFQFTFSPGYLTWAANGDLLVTDGVSKGIRTYTLDGVQDSQLGCCNFPTGVSDDHHGHIFVAEALQDRIKILSADGTFLAEYGTQGSGEGQFNGPDGLAIDASGALYVCDTHNNRIQKFVLTGVTAIRSSSWGRLKALYR